MQYEPDKLHARLISLGEDWADKEAAASLLEETRRSVRAELMRESNATSVAAAEAQAEAAMKYKEHLKDMVEARRIANRANVNYKAAMVYIDLYRSHEATRRAELTKL